MMKMCEPLVIRPGAQSNPKFSRMALRENGNTPIFLAQPLINNESINLLQELNEPLSAIRRKNSIV